MDTAIFFIFLFLTSFSFAKLEIEIEGRNGWAENLPTWKLPKDNWLNKILGGRTITGYHLWTHIYILLLAHLVFSFVPFSWNIEFKILSFLILFWVLEDFLWFVLNPSFSIKKFKKEFIPWHAKNWFLFAPVEYFIFVPVGVILYFISF